MILAGDRFVNERPAGRSFLLWAGLASLLILGACASLQPATSQVVARSTLGDVAGSRLAGALDRASRKRPDLRDWRAHPGIARGFLEEWLCAEALAEEARREGLDRTEEGRAHLQRRRHEALVELLESQLEGRLPVPSDAEVQAFLQANQALVHPGERIRLRHIFRRLPSSASQEQREQARAELEGYRQAVLAGADLGALAREHSDSETAKFDGLIAPQSRGQLPPSVEAVVWALQPGELSPVVETPIGPHIFRLEERLPAETLTEQQQRDWARLRLTHEARHAARQQERERLTVASGAIDTPEAVAVRRAAPDLVAFRLGALAVRASDLMRERERLPFAERHTRTLEELADAQALGHLLAWAAEHDSRWTTPDVSAALEDADQRALAELATPAHLERWRASLPDDELRAFFASAPGRYAPERWHLRVVVLWRQPGASPHATFERLEAVAKDLRLGWRDLAAVAREMSEDASWEQGGDLGWVLPRDFSQWAGPTALDRVSKLSSGELAGPLLLESYREDQLAYVPAGHLLVRLEDREPEGSPSFEDVRPAVAQALANERAAQAEQAVRQEVLDEVHAEIDDGALARLAATR